MKYKKQFKMSVRERRYRHFSEEFKRKKVREIEEGRASVIQVCKANEVSNTAVYKWIELYSHQTKPTRTIVESKSDTQKILVLQKRIAELERLLGQKQVELEFKSKMIDIAEESYNIDIKKKLGIKR